MNKRIRKVLKTIKKTDKYICDKLDISTDTLSSYKIGIEPPTIKFIELLVEELPTLNINWLISGDGEMLQDKKVVLGSDLKINILEKRYENLEKMYQKLSGNYDLLKAAFNKRTDKDPYKKEFDEIWDFIHPPTLIGKLIQFSNDNPDQMKFIKDNIDRQD